MRLKYDVEIRDLGNTSKNWRSQGEMEIKGLISLEYQMMAVLSQKHEETIGVLLDTDLFRYGVAQPVLVR